MTSSSARLQIAHAAFEVLDRLAVDPLGQDTAICPVALGLNLTVSLALERIDCSQVVHHGPTHIVDRVAPGQFQINRSALSRCQRAEVGGVAGLVEPLVQRCRMS